MSATISPAVQRNLDRVVAEEQRSAARRMAQIRLAMGSLAVLALVPLAGRPELRPSLIGAALFFLLALAILLGILRAPRLGAWAWLATALVDVPAVATIQYVQQGRLPLIWWGIPGNVALMLALVAGSSLSLSRPVIFATAGMALASIQMTLYRAEVPYFPRVMVGTATFVIAFVGATLVGRLRAMVHAARRRDLVGKYVLGDRIGAGGMAEVFTATYSPEGGFERRVAVKRILPSSSHDATSIALFRREAELGALLAHPNVVQVLDFGTDGDTWFLAMELIEGVTLSRLLASLRRAGQPLPLPAAVLVAGQMAEAIAYVHERTTASGGPLGLIHRDINPPNVLVSKIGEVKLGDFGIARATDQQTLTAVGVMRGKIGYSAPEQLKGEPYDSRADLFALGATLHELLAGERLFKGDSEATLLRDCLAGPLFPPSTVRPDVPTELDHVVMGLLEREVHKRTSSAREVLRGLATLPARLTDEKEGRRLLSACVAKVQAEPAPPLAPALRLRAGPNDATRDVQVR